MLQEEKYFPPLISQMEFSTKTFLKSQGGRKENIDAVERGDGNVPRVLISFTLFKSINYDFFMA